MSEQHPYLEKLADLAGIENNYLDNWGRSHDTSDYTKKKILQAFGFDVHSAEALKNSFLNYEKERQEKFTETTLIVLGDALPERLFFNLPQRQNESHFLKPSVTLEVTQNGGVSEHLTHDNDDNGEIFLHESIQTESALVDHWSIPFPTLHNMGYYRFRLSVRYGDVRKSEEIFVAVCPKKAFMPKRLREGGKEAGVFFSLYGVRSEKNWGIGDFGDLNELIVWVASELKGSLIGINPLHATYNRAPYNTSPYLPISKYYRNFIYLNIPEMADYTGSSAEAWVNSPEVTHTIKKLRDSLEVRYEAVADLKLKALEMVFQKFLEKEWKISGKKTERACAFEKYMAKEGPFLDSFALFCALDTKMHKENPDVWIWKQWPQEYQTPHTSAVKRFRDTHREDILFFKYIQWQIEEQLSKAQETAKKCGMTVGIYHDLALAVDRYGADCWAYPEHYISGASVGAPPDAFSQSGQDWGFPPLDGNVLKKNHYGLFLQEIQKNCACGGALRIDHVMRFFHLYLIPEGSSPAEGAYVTQAWEDLIRLLCLESVRNRVVMIGEDLGTVPNYIRKHLEDAGILSYRLLYFEKNEVGAFIKPDRYPEMALVTVTTHDLPTLNGFWMHRDIEVRRDALLFQNESVMDEAVEERKNDKKGLIKLTEHCGLLGRKVENNETDIEEISSDVHSAIIGVLAITPSKLFVLNQEDLFKEREQQNLPGTVDQYPNWSIKMKYSVEEMTTNSDAVALADMFRTWVEKSGRAIIDHKEDGIREQ